MNAKDQKRQRSCVNCAEKKHQSELIRLVRDDSGRVVIDVSGKIAGRGSYVCSESCLRTALSSGRLGRALRTKIEIIEHENIVSEYEDKMCVEDR